MRFSRVGLLNVILGIIFVSILILLCFIFFLFLSQSFEKNSNSTSSLSRNDFYQYQEISPQNPPSYGFVELPQTLSDDDFISYFNPSTDSSIIISNIASTPYECRGSCSCSEPVRRSSSLFTRPLILFFSALSSTLALQIATKTFQDQCLHQLSDICDEPNIHSEVYSCSEQSQQEEEILEEEEEYAQYSCKGHCLPRILRAPSAQQAQKDFITDNGPCEDFKTSAIVKIKVKRGNSKAKYTLKSGQTKIYTAFYSSQYTRAKDKFSKEIMVPFCKQMGKGNYMYVYPNRDAKLRKDVNFCVAGRKFRKHDHLNCKLISDRKNKKMELMEEEEPG